jgi:hypothetical protein
LEELKSTHSVGNRHVNILAGDFNETLSFILASGQMSWPRKMRQ